jgi:hypothetical protein
MGWREGMVQAPGHWLNPHEIPSVERFVHVDHNRQSPLDQSSSQCRSQQGRNWRAIVPRKLFAIVGRREFLTEIDVARRKEIGLFEWKE